MPKLFLSYSRKDSAKAQRFTDWLEGEGHDVWRDDDDIGGGASFSSEIEKALEESEAVLVLWSADSVQSAWVRDEAAFGRDARKLIPFSIDGTGPPMGFRQFQSIDISTWKGRGQPPRSDQIRSAIARISGLSQAAPATVPAAGPRRSRIVRTPLLVGAAIAAVGALLLLAFLWERWAANPQIAIAVLPSPQSSDRAMAADYANVAAADMAAYLPRRFDRATVISPAEATGPTSGYRMLISTNPHGPAVNATLMLSDQDGRTTLWSKNWSVADASAADLKQEVSAAASKAALCLADARGGSKRLSQPALALFLTGCTGIGDTQLSDVDFKAIFERVTKLAPDFAPGWDYLALSRANIAQEQSKGSPAYEAAVRSTRQAIAMARKMNPNSALAYHAEYHLISNDHIGALQVLDKAAALDPNDGLIQMHLSDELFSVGRTADSVQAARQAVELEPGSAWARSQYIKALTYSGQFSNAKTEIADARKRWPNDLQIDYAEFGFQFRYGDARVALELLPRVVDSGDASMVPYRKVIAARLDPTAAKVDSAIAALKASSTIDPRRQNIVLLALGNFGRVDEAYGLLEDAKFQPFIETNALFRPDFAGVRADPRFMRVAAGLSLIRYWRKTGYWPDFCSTERLHYDCKAEAAKYQ